MRGLSGRDKLEDGSSLWNFVSQDTVLTPDQCWYASSVSRPVLLTLGEAYGERPYRGSWYVVVLRGNSTLFFSANQTVLLHEKVLSACSFRPVSVCTVELVCVAVNYPAVTFEVYNVFGNMNVDR